MKINAETDWILQRKKEVFFRNNKDLEKKKIAQIRMFQIMCVYKHKTR